MLGVPDAGLEGGLVMRRGAVLTAVVLCSALGAGNVEALQYTPSATSLLHTPGSGQPGVPWSTEGVGVGGQVTFNQGTGILNLTGKVQELNFFDPLNGSCSTDAGSNCNVNFSPDLDVTLSGSLLSLVITPLGGTFFDLTANFGTLGPNDLLVTDPSAGNAVALAASWQSGLFLGSPTTGLSVSVTYDAFTSSVLGDPLLTGFLAIDNASPYASLFGSTVAKFGVNLGDFGSFSPSLNAIAQNVLLFNSIPSFTAEGQGQVFRLASGDFVVPEPATALLVAMGLAGLAVRRRS